ncbi:DUF397 domain-containing protein [Streptomyces sp. NPDC093111]|uniref:DUF397 domain-containing protein n=1 Tax=Streptomyces sp. NPDC093111 TaxID=3154978 RepID=UPI0034456459
MRQPDLNNASWIKSSYSGNDGGNCVEIAAGFAGWVPVRDSKAPTGPVLKASAPAWAAFIGALRG